MGTGEWGLGTGDWGDEGEELITHAQCPMPDAQSPIPSPFVLHP
ncbi:MULTISPECIES: hypothetical protein [Nostoc]|nr:MULTISPECIES: hypothetical protein [Nostoc]